MALITSSSVAAVLLLLLLLLASELPAAAADNCTTTTTCGNVTVPYPFGITGTSAAGCYWPGFNLTCAVDVTSGGKQLLLGDGSLQVKEISINNGTVRVVPTSNIIKGFGKGGYGAWYGGLTDHGPYTMSSGNEIVVVGCNVYATLQEKNTDNIIGGCASFCSDDDYGRPGQRDQTGRYYCNGMGCCRAPIVETLDDVAGMVVFKLIDSLTNRSQYDYPRMFIAEEGWFDQSQFYANVTWQEDYAAYVAVPVLLRWTLLDDEDHPLDPGRNEEAFHHICKSSNSLCMMRGRGYTCSCRPGYEGNPYTIADGCKEISECDPKDPKSCIKKVKAGLAIGLGVGSGLGIIVLILTIFFIVRRIKHQRARKLKHQFFEQNRGQLLQQLISHRTDIAEKMIISLEELEKATNNFDKSRELGGGGHGTVYKGILSDLHVVAIKKPKLAIQKEIDEFINEVAILSQVNHRNVVKIYGCCLETEVPLLVYEFVSNGTLYDHLHARSLSWSDRLRIASETAKSLAYLHCAVLVPVIHRDIKSVNILLDDTLTAKVADFGASRYIALEKSGLTTMVQGTIGYLDPMYFYTSRLTDKSDVYSFGVVLIELLTRKKPFSYMSSNGESLVENFVTLFVEGKVSQILDPTIVDEGGKQVEGVATLAVACVKLKGEDRPTMRQVELTLEGLQISTYHAPVSQVVNNGNMDDRAMNFQSTKEGRNNDNASRQYSLEEEYMLSAKYPR